jgi:hypothetical protein
MQNTHRLNLAVAQTCGLSRAALQAIPRLRFSARGQERPFSHHGEIYAYAIFEFNAQSGL